MKIGRDCFNDENLLELYKDAEIGICDITNVEDDIIDTEKNDVLQSKFSSLLDIFALSISENSGKKLLDYFVEWNTFKLPKDKITQILEELLKDKNDYQIYLNSNLEIAEAESLSILKDITWHEFEENIKHVNRFSSYRLINESNLETFLSGISKNLNPIKDNYYYRVRIYDNNVNKDGFKRKEMGPPPMNLARNGRVMPEGISCLYLANNITTCYAEARVRKYDTVTIGYFKQESPLVVVDLSMNKWNILSPFGILGPDFVAKNFTVMKEIIENVEKPLRPFDSHLDYLPTQFICDFVKGVLNYDGILYNSTLYKDGKNLALFNEAKMKCTKIERKEIKSYTSYEEISI